MHISNRLHWALSALQTVLPEFQAPHLCHYIRKIAKDAFYPLTDMLCQVPVTHRSPRHMFLVAQVHYLFLHLIMCFQWTAEATGEAEGSPFMFQGACEPFWGQLLLSFYWSILLQLNVEKVN